VTRKLFWNGSLAAFLGLSLGVLGGCAQDLTACETDLDCVIVCECDNRDGTLTVGPFACRAGTCGASHAEERSCERVCGTAPSDLPSLDDDDSSSPDDDDSAR